MKKNAGITLIALIITIVVMLILVAVSVKILISSDLIGTTGETHELTEISAEKEKIQDAYFTALANNEGEKVTAGDLQTALEKLGENTQSSGTNILRVQFLDTNRTYEINSQRNY